MPVFSPSPIRVQPYFGYRSASQLTLSARALRAGKHGFENKGRLQAIRTMIAQFASREVADLPVQLDIKRPDGKVFSASGRTDEEGFVHFDVPLEGHWPLPDQTSWDVVILSWANDHGAQQVEGHVLAPAKDAKLAVVSDIDDTVIETGITGNLRAIARNWRRVVMQLPEERLSVPGVEPFYGALGGGAVLHNGEAHLGDRVTATQRPFFYVSSSPWNLYSYLIAFMKLRELPLGPIHLRDWGFNRETLGSSGHGQHKRHAIDSIIARYADLHFALVGDDTQGDLVAYAGVVADYPGRIAAVFFRTAGMEAMSPEEIAAKASIEKAGVPLWLGDDYATGHAFLETAGLAGEQDAQHLLEVVEEGPQPNGG